MPIYAVVHSVPTYAEKLKFFATRKEAVAEMEKVYNRLRKTKKVDALATTNPHKWIGVVGNEWYSIRSVKLGKIYVGHDTRY